jgi:hypothetical protein
MSSLAINNVGSLLSVSSFVFFIVASVGYSDKKGSLRNIPWFTGTYSGIFGSGNVHFGLRTVYNAGAIDEATIDFGDDNCPFAFCDECKRDGDTAMALVITAIFATFFEAVISCASTASTTVFTQWVQMGFALVAAVMVLVAIDLFMNDCYSAVDDASGYDLHWGTGAILAMFGMLLMWADVIVHAVGVMYASRDGNYGTA